jgi:hypothetical protein
MGASKLIFLPLMIEGIDTTDGRVNGSTDLVCSLRSFFLVGTFSKLKANWKAKYTEL